MIQTSPENGLVFFIVTTSLALTWRPIELTSAHQMEMEMINRLTTGRSDIGYHSISVVQFLFPSNVLYHGHQVTDQRLVTVIQMGNALNFFFGDNENVYGCLGSNVLEGQAKLVFKNNVGWDFSVDDLFENGHDVNISVTIGK